MATKDQLYMSNFWWVLTVRGIAAILFGLAAIFWPGLTIVTLVYLFSAYILVSGVVGLIHNLTGIGREGMGWILWLVLSFLEIGVGVYLLRNTGVAFLTFVQLIGLVLVVRGVFEVVVAFTESDEFSSRSLIILGGIISVLAGVIVLRQPVGAGVAFVWILGIYSLIEGPVLIARSLEVRNNTNRPRRA